MSITVTVLASLTNVLNILRTPNYTGHCHSCVHCGAAWDASMAEYSVHAADEMLLTFELVIAKDGFDTGILYFCYLSNWQKQASNHMKWVRQIHGWSWKIVQDRHFETKTKTKTAKNRSQAASRPRPRARGLQDCLEPAQGQEGCSHCWNSGLWGSHWVACIHRMWQ